MDRTNVEIWGGENDGQIVPVVNDVVNPGHVILTYANGVRLSHPLWKWQREDGSIKLVAICVNGPVIAEWIRQGHV